MVGHIQEARPMAHIKLRRVGAEAAAAAAAAVKAKPTAASPNAIGMALEPKMAHGNRNIPYREGERQAWVARVSGKSGRQVAREVLFAASRRFVRVGLFSDRPKGREACTYRSRHSISLSFKT